MPGRATRKLQLGKETVAGTAIAATTIWRGVGTLEDASEYVMPAEDVGLFSGTDRQYNPKVLAKLAMDDTEATFEQLPYILEAGIRLVNTGVVDTGGSGKVYAYAVATGAAPTIRTFTVEGGDATQEEEMEFGFVEDFELSAKAGEAWKMKGNWVGRQITPSTYTSPLSIPTVEEILFSKSSLYIDTTTIGTTTKSNTLLGCNIKVKTGNTYIFTADGGQKYFSFNGFQGADIEMSITFEHDASALAEKAAWRAGTRRLIRIKSVGSPLTTAGTFTNKTLQIDLGGKWLKFDKLGEENGNDIVTGTFKVRPDSTGANYATFTVVNEQASII